MNIAWASFTLDIRGQLIQPIRKINMSPDSLIPVTIITSGAIKSLKRFSRV
jgi:hypothetical protein